MKRHLENCIKEYNLESLIEILDYVERAKFKIKNIVFTKTIFYREIYFARIEQDLRTYWWKDEKHLFLLFNDDKILVIPNFNKLILDKEYLEKWTYQVIINEHKNRIQEIYKLIPKEYICFPINRKKKPLVEGILYRIINNIY